MRDRARVSSARPLFKPLSDDEISAMLKSKEESFQANEHESIIIDLLDVESYEAYRDSYRLMMSAMQFFAISCLVLTCVSSYFTITRESSKSYITTTHGRVVEIQPLVVKAQHE
jgi:hypothetical protein